MSHMYNFHSFIKLALFMPLSKLQRESFFITHPVHIVYLAIQRQNKKLNKLKCLGRDVITWSTTAVTNSLQEGDRLLTAGQY